MKIGFLLSGNYAVGNAANGVLAQAKAQAKALRELGCEVTELNPWNPVDLSSYDVIQFFQGGLNFHMVEANKARMSKGILVFAPIIDTNQSNAAYRFATKMGRTLSKVFTVPSEFYVQAEKSDLVICRSQHEKSRIIDGLGIDSEKVEIVLNGTDLPARVTLDKGALRKKYNLPDEFVLHVSAYSDERKNVLKLVQAVTELGYPLIVAGNAMKGNILDKLTRLAAMNENITVLGFVEKEHLDAMYECCKVFCLPSIHEGTGLVALEAGVRGANIVITQNGGPPDYFDDLVEYVDPDDVLSIKDGVEKAWHKSQSEMLISHINNKLKWADSAKGLLSVYTKYIEVNSLRNNK